MRNERKGSPVTFLITALAALLILAVFGKSVKAESLTEKCFTQEYQMGLIPDSNRSQDKS